MPAPGDQYNSDIQNPFEERVVNGFTAQEIATLQCRLNKQLGPEYISQRPGNGGGRVAYLEGNKAIALANEVFGFNGWSSSLGQVQIDYVDENPQNGRVSLGLSIVVRITLKDGTYHEDIGYGSIENGKSKAASFEKAKKEAATDGLKRALRTFGNVLGNCLYDKEYLRKVQAMKVKPRKFDEINLHRHADYAPPPPVEGRLLVKKEEAQTPVRSNAILRTRTELLTESTIGEFDDEFDGNLFDGVEISEHQSDEFSLAAAEEVPKTTEPAKPASVPNQNASRMAPAANPGPQRPPNPRGQTTPALRGPNGPQPPVQQQQPPNHGPGRPPMNGPNLRGPQTPVQQQTAARPEQGRPQVPPTANIHGPPRPLNPNLPPPNQPVRPTPPQQNQPPANAPPSRPPGFVTSRAAELIQGTDPNTPLNNIPAFNPHADSPVPKDKRTPGIDHTSSRPIKRQDVITPAGPHPPAGPLQPPHPPPPPAANNNSNNGPSNNGTGTGPGPGPGFNRPAQNTFSRPTNANFINPQQDMNRRIGMPAGGAAMSPTLNRAAYKPPMKRQALQDVSNARGGAAGGLGGEPEAKRLKVEGAVGSGGEENAAPAVGS